jgi:hypothetical protein
VVGGILSDRRIDRDPMAWVSADGVAWRRTTVPATDSYEEMQRVAVRDGVVYALGFRGQSFVSWRLDGDKWVETASFGSVKVTGLGSVRSVTVVDGKLLTMTSDGTAFGMWMSKDGASWRTVQAPVPAPAGGDKMACIAAFAQRVVLLIDDGGLGRVWAADQSVTF